MKILHVVPTYLPALRYGGPMFAVHALCRALVGLGHEVHVCTTNIDGPIDLEVPAGAPLEMDGVSVWYFRADRLRRLAISSGMQAWIGARIAQFDLLHTHSVYLWPPWYAARSARTRGIAYVMAPRGMLVPEMIARRNRLAKTLWLRLLEWRNLAGADAVHFTSELERTEAERLGVPVRRAVVIPNGIDPEELRAVTDVSAGQQPESYILYLGRLNWKKGLDCLLRAMALAPALRAVIAGNDEGSCRTSLERLAGECGVTDRVRFLDPVYGEAKWRLLRGAHALVLPSQSENFGNAVLEAMAAGKPVVVSPGVGLSATVRESACGLVVDPEPGALAAALEKLWRDESLCHAMGERGRALVERDYNWPLVAGQVERMYRSILETRGVGATPS